MRNLTFEIGSHSLQAADGHRLAVHTRPTTSGLARSIAGSPENAGEHVRFAIDHVGVGISLLRDQTDVFRHVGVRRARPLAVDDSVVVVRVSDVSTLHKFSR